MVDKIELGRWVGLNTVSLPGLNFHLFKCGNGVFIHFLNEGMTYEIRKFFHLARFSSLYMWKWGFHPFSRCMNDVWIKKVFSSSKIHTLDIWDLFISILIFSSYHRQRKSIHEVFSSLDQFQLKFPNVFFYLLQLMKSRWKMYSKF